MDFKLILNNKQRKTLKEIRQSMINNGDHEGLLEIEAIQLLVNGSSIRMVAARYGVCVSIVRSWIKKFLLNAGDDFFKTQVTGRPGKLSEQDRKKLYDLLMDGPASNGFTGACWRSSMVQQLIQQIFDIVYCVKYIPELLRTLGFTYQRASFVASQRDDKAREIWLTQTWPQIESLQKENNSYLLFGDECSFAQWGTQSYTWAPKGFTPLVQNGGCRKNYKLFGAIDYITGRFFTQTTHGRLNAESYIAFLSKILRQTRKHVILIQDGARYHQSKTVKDFIEKNKKRLVVYTLPSYSPDFNPIEKLWKKIKTGYTHLHYFPTFEDLVDKVNGALEDVQAHCESWVKPLFRMYRNISCAA